MATNVKNPKNDLTATSEGKPEEATPTTTEVTLSPLGVVTSSYLGEDTITLRKPVAITMGDTLRMDY